MYSCIGDGPDPTNSYLMGCPFECLGPACGDRECGPDGCGGVCGSCSDGYTCTDGECCEQDCLNKQCGPDGCGGYCGTCEPGSRCTDIGTCELCLNACNGKECGFDGCGGYCGNCPSGQKCVTGQCLDTCDGIPEVGCCWGDVAIRCHAPSGGIIRKKCGPGENYCGWDPESERHACMTEGGEDPSGQYPLSCFEQCFPACWWKECGNDGCGGDCGACPTGQSCEGGFCVGDIVEPGPEYGPDIGPEQTSEDIVEHQGETVDGSDLPGQHEATSVEIDTQVGDDDVIGMKGGGKRGCSRSGRPTPLRQTALFFLVLLVFLNRLRKPSRRSVPWSAGTSGV